MTPAEYLEACRFSLITSPVVQAYQIIEAHVDERRGYLRVKATLSNGDFAEFAEYFVAESSSIITQDYRFQWMDAECQKLRCRWDNTPHFPALSGFPHHVHGGESQSASPSQPMNLESVLIALEKVIILR